MKSVARIIYALLGCFWFRSTINDYVIAETFKLGYLTGSQRKPGDMEYTRPGLTISGAITIAVNEVNAVKLKRYNHSIEIVVAETYGDEEISIKQTATLWTQGVSGYIGPQETCNHEGRMAAAFNLPMISYFCTHHETSNKKYFPTFGRTRPPETQISKSVVSLLRYFNWTQVSFFYLNDNEFIPVAETILSALKEHGLQLRSVMTWDSIYHHGYMRNPFDRMIEQTYMDTRIYLILGHHYEHIGLVVSLQQHGLLDNGDYFVVGVDLEQYDLASPEKYLRGVLQNDPDPDSVTGFQSYLGIIPSAPVKFEEFASEVNKYLEMEPFGYVNPLNHIGGVKQIRAEAAFLYDAVHLYANSLTRVIDEGGDPKNGTQILNALKGSNYQSAMGYIVHVDENGDAAGNYTILARKFLNDSVGFGLVPVGIFSVPKGDQLPKMHLNEIIEFVGGDCPVAEPECGFRGEKCINYTGEITMGIAGGALVVLGFVALVLYRNWKYEQELDSLLWKIDFRDIKMHDVDKENGGHKVTRSNHPLIRTSQVSLSSNPDADFRYSTIFTPIGLYKGQLYAIKKMKKKNIDITREMKKELKMLKDIRYENLNAFVGACIEPPNICIITEYCNKGSLKDVLENEDVKLDNMFIASLVGDIIRAMIYLHESPIKFHGNLCASNCLIDSRWVVKLSDFGLFAFKQGVEEKIENPADLLKCENKLLYRAPELLRAVTDTCIPSWQMWQKGDIYSFAIILYEIHTRRGPFGEIDCSAMECLERILYPRDASNPFRPAIQALESCFDCVRDVIKEAWTECPDDRPDFKTIRTRLRPLRKGMKPNIFDNMILMMEKYANNLEQLVDERTDQLQTEKKKTEALLLEMLPRPVAEQLKKGHKVEAESYDMVTIYFSDIVGFTAMSATSTPLQVVDFLNDLYTCFDSIIGNYDIYKVETIGDAYMVVSGLPIRNQFHAAEIATMSLDLLDAVKEFKIRHRPDEKLLLRIGIHSGPVCAGVVGLKMPRYCLFGDTVNTASRMESTGMQLKIHCSDDCRELLEKLGGYIFEERGLIPMKGKGEKKTFWLMGEDPDIRARRTRERKERRGSKALNKFIQKNHLLNGDLLGIRSSLKQNNNGYGLFKSLPRSSSLESPKKLRFASTTFLEYNRYSDDVLMEVISNCSPRKSNGSIQIGEDLASSCPCIENCGSVNEKDFCSAATTPLLTKQQFQMDATGD